MMLVVNTAIYHYGTLTMMASLISVIGLMLVSVDGQNLQWNSTREIQLYVEKVLIIISTDHYPQKKKKKIQEQLNYLILYRSIITLIILLSWLELFLWFFVIWFSYVLNYALPSSISSKHIYHINKYYFLLIRIYNYFFACFLSFSFLFTFKSAWDFGIQFNKIGCSYLLFNHLCKLTYLIYLR